MSGLHMVHIPLAPHDLARIAGQRGWTRATARDPVGTFDEGVALHHLSVEAFGPGALRPFRLMVAPGGRSAALYGYSHHSADALRGTAHAIAPPEIADLMSPEGLRAKPMPQNWTAGQRVGFDLRVRPVRRLKKAVGGRRPGAEIDVFVHEALSRFDADENGMLTSGRSRAAVYGDWLAERLAGDGIARLEGPAALASFARERAVRKGRAVEGPAAVLRGTLVIERPAAFADLLHRGIGRHTAYGYGMVLLRAPQEQPIGE